MYEENENEGTGKIIKYILIGIFVVFLIGSLCLCGLIAAMYLTGVIQVGESQGNWTVEDLADEPMDPSVQYEGIVDLNDSNFDEEVLDSQLPVLVLFYYRGCKPAWEAMSGVKKIADMTRGKLKVCKIEASTVYILETPRIDNPIISRRYRVGGMPTVIIFNNGTEVIRDLNGVDPNLYYKDIKSTIEALIGVKIGYIFI